MDRLSLKFDNFIKSNIPNDKLNKYIIAIICVMTIIYANLYAPRLPYGLVRLFDNNLVKLLMMFFMLYVVFKTEPFVALVISVLLIALLLAFNMLNREHMAMIGDNSMNSIPEYVYSTCHHPVREGCDVVAGVSDAEVESLCMHLKKDKNATDEIITSSQFSELLNTTQACDFAKHQYKINLPNVKCADKTEAYDEPFPTPAPQ